MRLSRSITPCAAALLFCAGPAPSAPAPAPAEKPVLVVFLSIDQMRVDYFERWKEQLQGGLARLRSQGAFFTNAHQDHAITETAPGHASLLSGRFPRSTGITRNLAGVNDRAWHLIGTSELGAAPFRFRGTTLTDWMIATDSGTRAFSVSSKDRGAILPIGRSKQEVYWFANNGTFTTSIWYKDTLPPWVEAFNARRTPHSYAGKTWDLLLDQSQYQEVDSVRFEGAGRNFLFPHRFPTDSVRAAAQMRYSPLMDELTIAFALEGLRRLELGRGPSTDVLAISLSATDYVGHFYGPDSREMHDQIVRLDRLLGRFFEALFSLRDSTRIIVALSADHAVGRIPELAGHLRVSTDPAMDAARAAMVKAGGDSTAVDIESGAFFVDTTLARSRAAVEASVKAFMAAAKLLPGVQRVDRFVDLKRKNLEKDYVARRWLQMFPDDLMPEAVITLKEGDIYDYPIIATHGSPHDSDSNVPIVFWGPPFKPGRYDRFVRTVDIAPTLAKALGVTPAERVDGRPLDEAFR